MRRAVTILELLLVIGILASILALAAPALLPLVQERRFDATQQMLQDWLWRVRSDSVAQGHALMIRVQETPEGVWVTARRADLSEVSGEEPGSGGADEFVRRFHLGEGLEISLSSELSGAAGEADGPVVGDGDFDMVLGMFLPSGGAVQTQAFYLRDQRGRRQGFQLSPLTGRLLRVDPMRDSELSEAAPTGRPGA
ncbi:MAG: hypothetical protein EA380_10475 [Phycisphaeraceae bacterium]|nr:MAG: hypothetical protein EA380_10475 [Phycisphaeraceae bacterium]